MFCQKCGKEIHSDAVVCIHCGCSVNRGSSPLTQQTPRREVLESSSTANCALLFAFLVPIVGLILGIIGVNKYITPSYKSRSVSAIVISIVVWIISFVLLLSMYELY